MLIINQLIKGGGGVMGVGGAKCLFTSGLLVSAWFGGARQSGAGGREAATQSATNKVSNGSNLQQRHESRLATQTPSLNKRQNRQPQLKTAFLNLDDVHFQIVSNVVGKILQFFIYIYKNLNICIHIPEWRIEKNTT